MPRAVRQNPIREPVSPIGWADAEARYGLEELRSRSRELQWALYDCCTHILVDSLHKYHYNLTEAAMRDRAKFRQQRMSYLTEAREARKAKL